MRSVRSFLTIWAGQLVSLIGSGLTAFALAVWVYQETGSVTMFSFLALATTVPGILLSPIAGLVVDRWDRRLVMIASDAGAAACTLAAAALLFAGSLELWQIVVLLSLSSAFESFQSPAYASAVPLLVPRERLGRFNGLIQLGVALPKIVSPLLAGLLIEVVHLGGILLLDCATFLVGIATLLSVRLPRPAPAARREETGGSLLREATEGWRFLKARTGLLAVLLFFAVTHFTLGIVNVGFPALILSFASAASLGTLMALAGAGLVAGSVAMSVWGGPKRRIDGVLGFTVVFGLGAALAGLRPALPGVAAGMLLIAVSAPLIAGCGQALWQTKVPSHLQGRVFALRDMVARSALPLAYVLAGPLADRVLEPLMAGGGALAGNLGRLLGVGPGRGVGLMFVLFGMLAVAAALAAWLRPQIRHVEDEIPDALPDEAEPPFASLDAKT